MDITALTEYIVLVVFGLCLCIGFCIKSLERVNNKYIPTILAGFGILFAIWLFGWEVSPEVILKGMMSGLAAVGAHQAFYQLIYKDRKEDVIEITEYDDLEEGDNND